MHPLSSRVGNDFDVEKYLYHYTRMDTAINCILHFNTLRFSRFFDVNDPMESDREAVGSFPGLSSEEKVDLYARVDEFLRKQVRVSCFSRDDQFDPDSPGDIWINHCGFGYSKPRMWATYGDDHQGACLIFDKARLRNAFENHRPENVRFLHGPVRYSKRSPLENTLITYNVEALREDHELELQSLIDRYHRGWFFSKHADWTTENEYRFVISGGDPKPIDLPFDDALVGVVVGKKAENKPGYLNALCDLAQRSGIPCVKFLWGWQTLRRSDLNGAAKQLPP